MSVVLRGFSAYNVLDVRLGGNPCAAYLIEKTAHFQIGNKLEYFRSTRSKIG